jgi:large subunit ribosomal protein L9
LLKDIARLGKAGDVKTVADGYARNYLIPRGLAKLATEGAIKQAEEKSAADARRQKRLHIEAEEMAAKLTGVTLNFARKVGEGEKIYGSVTAADIAEALSRQVGAEINRHRIELDEPIKTLGIHRVPIRLHGSIAAQIMVVVDKEE